MFRSGNRCMVSDPHQHYSWQELTGIAEDVVAVTSVARVQQDASREAACAALILVPADGDLHAEAADLSTELEHGKQMCEGVAKRHVDLRRLLPLRERLRCEHRSRRNTTRRMPHMCLHGYDLDCVVEFDAAEVAQVVEPLDAVSGGLPDDGAGVAEHHVVGADCGRRRRYSAESGSCRHTLWRWTRSSHTPDRAGLASRWKALLRHGHGRKHICRDEDLCCAASASTATRWVVVDAGAGFTRGSALSQAAQTDCTVGCIWCGAEARAWRMQGLQVVQAAGFRARGSDGCPAPLRLWRPCSIMCTLLLCGRSSRATERDRGRMRQG